MIRRLLIVIQSLFKVQSKSQIIKLRSYFKCKKSQMARGSIVTVTFPSRVRFPFFSLRCVDAHERFKETRIGMRVTRARACVLEIHATTCSRGIKLRPSNCYSSLSFSPSQSAPDGTTFHQRNNKRIVNAGTRFAIITSSHAGNFWSTQEGATETFL